MTMFNWQARDGEPVYSTHLWVYFVITIPLTVLVLSVWFWWFRSQEKNQKHDIELQQLPPRSRNSVDKFGKVQ